MNTNIFDKYTGLLVLLMSLTIILQLHPLAIGWNAGLAFVALLIDLRDARVI